MADVSSYHDATSNVGPLLLGLSWSLAGLSTIILTLRMYSGIFIIRRIKLPDHLIVLAFACVIIQTSFMTVSVHWGLGRHSSFLDDTEKLNSIKFITLCEGWGIASAVFGRMSFCFYLLQFTGTYRTRRWLLYSLAGSQAFVNCLTIILIYVQCGNHVEALWDDNVNVPCWSPHVQAYTGFFQSSWNSLTDLSLTVLPATIIWNLKITRLQKLGISFLLGISLFAFIESIVKCYMIKELGGGDDLTWRLAIFHVWAISESYIVIIGASIPTLTSLWRRVIGSSTYQQSYEMYGSHRASRRSFVAVEDGRPISDTQKSNHNTGQGSIRDDNTSQEHILEPAGEHS